MRPGPSPDKNTRFLWDYGATNSRYKCSDLYFSCVYMQISSLNKSYLHVQRMKWPSRLVYTFCNLLCLYSSLFIFINDLLLFIQNSDICNYADDTTIYTCNKSLDNIVHRLENDCSIASEWFADNFMKLNADKCHLLVLGQRDVTILLL